MPRIVSIPVLAAVAAVLAPSASAAVCPEPAAGEVEIYPSSEVLPANLLRAYIYFPRAMARGAVLDHVVLLDASGVEAAGAFLATRYELWSQDRRRLTVLFDPARVKTGLAAHNALGRALDVGARYTILVRGAAQDAQGCPLGADTAHRFVAGPADLTAPDPAAWSLSLPAEGAMEPISVHLGDPHDHLSIAYRLRVIDADGAPVAGGIDLAEGERVWRFTPRAPWTAQLYRLTIDPRLEDLAGNRPGALFDQPISEPAADTSLTVSFRPTAPSR